MTTPVCTEWFLDRCRTLPNHVIVLDGRNVAFCGTDRADAARIAAGIPDGRLTVEHTTGRDSRR